MDNYKQLTDEAYLLFNDLTIALDDPGHPLILKAHRRWQRRKEKYEIVHETEWEIDDALGATRRKMRIFTDSPDKMHGRILAG